MMTWNASRGSPRIVHSHENEKLQMCGTHDSAAGPERLRPRSQTAFEAGRVYRRLDAVHGVKWRIADAERLVVGAQPGRKVVSRQIFHDPSVLLLGDGVPDELPTRLGCLKANTSN